MYSVELAWDRPAHSGPRPSEHVLRVRVRPAPRESGNSATLANASGMGAGGGLPLRLAIALDTSSSMAGARLEYARTACLTILEQMRPEDRVSLAGDADRGSPWLEQSAGGPGARSAGERALESMQAQGVTRTDLALDWLLGALPVEPDTMRMGILITDGHATTPQGQPLATTGDLLAQAERLQGGGVTLYTVGLGDASNFNTSLLVDLSDRGRGAFLYAPTPPTLAGQLQERLAANQEMGTSEATLHVRSLRQGIVVKNACRIRPEFLPIERETIADSADATGGALSGTDVGTGTAVGTTSFQLGALSRDLVTDLLLSVEVPPPGFAEGNGQQPMLEVSLETDGTVRATEVMELLYTPSYAEAQRLDAEVNGDRLEWDLNLYTQALARTSSVQQTAALLGDIAHTARKAGKEALAVKATGDLMAMEKRGRLTADRATGFLVETRRTAKPKKSDPIE